MEHFSQSINPAPPVTFHNCVPHYAATLGITEWSVSRPEVHAKRLTDCCPADLAAQYHQENNESAFFSFRQISQEDKNWETNIQELQKKVS